MQQTDESVAAAAAAAAASPTSSSITQDPPPSCPIRTIPLEILLRISLHLTTPELCNLRLTCRVLEQSLFKSFTDEFFTRKQFMISEFSLDALVAISKSRLAWHLRHVHLGLEHLEESSVYRTAPDQYQSFARDYYAQQLSLWESGTVVSSLADAFQSLDNLETVVIRDFNSHKRFRDGPYAQWNSYGAPTMSRHCGLRLLVSSGDPAWHQGARVNYGGQIFQAVINALGVARVKVPAIEVMERHGNLLHDYVFHIPVYNEPRVLPILNNLKRLHLSIDHRWASSSHLHRDHGPFKSLYLRQFLAHCHALRDLRINTARPLRVAPQGDHYTDFVRWLAQPAPSADPVTEPALASSGPGHSDWHPYSPAFPHLETLSFGMITASIDDLLNVIRKHAPSLTSLELWRVVLVAPQYSADIRSSQDRVILWVRFFRELKEIPGLNLRHIKAGSLQQEIHQICDARMDVSYRSSVSMSQDKTYTGPDWKHFVAQEILPSLFVNWKMYLVEQDESDIDKEEYDEYDEMDDEMNDDDDDQADGDE